MLLKSSYVSNKKNGDVYIKPQEPKMMGQGFLVFLSASR